MSLSALRNVLLGFAAAGLVACGGPSAENPCEDLPADVRCAEQGLHRCTGDNSGVQICEPDPERNGCLVWGEAVACGPLQTCQAEGIDARCVCNNNCEAGQSRCSGSNVLACQPDDYGCLDWATAETCAEPTPSCDDSSGTAKCVATCSDNCTEGNKRCTGSTLELCRRGDDGCLQWYPHIDCTNVGSGCVQAGDMADCCAHECDSEGDKQCNGDTIEICATDGDADVCREWKPEQDCSEGGTCDMSTGAPVCCTHDCTTPDALQCNGDLIEICAADGDADACLEWKLDTDCSENGETCDTNADPAACCANECDTAGAKQCNGNTVQVCVADGDADSCLEWVDETDCTQGGTSTDVCDASGGTAQCVCTNECTPENATRCNVDVIEICASDGDADTCLEWKAQTDCSANGQICDATQGDPQCIACTTNCDPANFTASCTAQGEPVNCTLHGTNCWTADTGPACGSNEACEVHDGVAECVPTCTEGLTDGSFEQVESNSTWTATSSARWTPMCDPSSCGSGSNYAFDGTWWVWMGGTQSGGDEVHVSQDFTIPAGRQATLYFLLWMPAVSGSPGEFVEVLVDDTQVWTADTSATEYREFYKLVSVDMSSYADGQSHTLDFHGVIVGPGTSIFLDYAGLGIGAYTTSSCCWNGCPAADFNYCGTDATGGNAAKNCVEQSNGCLDWNVVSCSSPTDLCEINNGVAQCVAATNLTVDGGWTVDQFLAGADTAIFSFTGTPGNTYYIWWDDDYDGSGAYSGDIEVAALQEDMSTSYFGYTDSGFTNPQTVTIATGESTVYIITRPWGHSDSSVGDYAIGVTSTNSPPSKKN